MRECLGARQGVQSNRVGGSNQGNSYLSLLMTSERRHPPLSLPCFSSPVVLCTAKAAAAGTQERGLGINWHTAANKRAEVA